MATLHLDQPVNPPLHGVTEIEQQLFVLAEKFPGPPHVSLCHQLSLSVRACALLPKSAFRAYALLRKIAFRACRQEGISWGWPCSIGQVPANPLGPGGEGSHLRGETLLM